MHNENNNLWQSHPDCEAQLERQGYFFLQNVPLDFDHFKFVKLFGQIIPQYDQKDIWSIKADPKFDNHYHSLNTQPLSPHTECYEFADIPNRLQALWCIKAADDGGGQTTLTDMYEFVDSLSEEAKEILKKYYEFQSSSGIRASRLGQTARHPVLSYAEASRPIIRLSLNCMIYENDQEMQAMANQIREFDEINRIMIRWQPHDLLVWDNWRMAHSRSGYVDRQRELKRVWIA